MSEKYSRSITGTEDLAELKKMLQMTV